MYNEALRGKVMLYNRWTICEIGTKLEDIGREYISAIYKKNEACGNIFGLQRQLINRLNLKSECFRFIVF